MNTPHQPSTLKDEPELREARTRELQKRMARNWNQVFDAIEGKRV